MARAAESMQTYHDVIRHWADRQPERLAFNFLQTGEETTDRLTFGQLDERARAVAAMLQGRGLAGQPVLLQYRPGLDFIVAFFACFYAGAIAVSAYPPTNNRSKSDRLKKLTQGCAARAILTNAATLPDLLREAAEDSAALPMICTDSIDAAESSAWRDPSLGRDAIAFLQYSSGSTGDPKGVIVSHGNILHNQQLIRQAMGNGPHSTIASWLPLFHDMGLIGNVMQPLFLGVSCHLMPPMAFLQEPLRWLRVISEYGVTCSGGPNFAYDLCVDKVNEDACSGLDLSTWAVAYNGAEPVRADTVQRFVQRYRPYGLAARAIYPCYGLAEATLFVSGPVAGEGAQLLDVEADALEAGSVRAVADRTVARRRTLVSSGMPAQDQRVWIVDPLTRRRRAPGEIGEIWLQGASVSRGYWMRPDADEAVFQACADAEDNQSFCRTGDLGVLLDGQLYVTGRLKEVLIIRGRNHYPQDIERTVQQAWTGFVSSGGAAFSCEVSAGEELVVVQEIARTALRHYNHDEAYQRAREAVAREHGLMLARLVPIKPATLAKTSSGKIRRSHMKALYQAGALAEVARMSAHTAASARAGEAAAADVVETTLREMGVDTARLDRRATLMQAGLDSLQLIDLQARLKRRLGVEPPVEWLFGDKTLAELEAALAGLRPAQARIDDDLPRGPAWLTPYQLAIWLRQQQEPAAPFFNLGLALELKAAVATAAVATADIEHALQAVLAQHTLLRSRIDLHDGRPVWVDDIGGYGDIVSSVDAESWSRERMDQWLFQFKNRRFRLEAEAPLRAAIMRRGAQGTVLALALHHVAIDLHGAAALAERLLAVLGSGGVIGSDTCSDLRALGRIDALAQNASAPDAGWLERLSRGGGELDLAAASAPLSVEPGPVPVTLEEDVDAEQIAALRTVAAERGCTLNALLAAAFGALLHRYTGHEQIGLGMPISVRPDGLEHWPGNAVNIVPLPLTFSTDLPLAQLIEQSARQVSTAVRHRHLPYSALLDLARLRNPDLATLYAAVFACQPEATENGGHALLATRAVWRRVGEIDVRGRAIAAATCQAPLALSVFPNRHGARLQLEFDPQRVPAEFAGRVLSHYRGMLRAFVGDLSQPLSTVDYLPGDELNRQWRTWNGQGFRPAPSEHLIERFLRQAERHADEEAVRDAHRSWSYGELVAAARQYCRALIEYGVQVGDTVGVAMPRDGHLPAALLGVLMCGAAYVPLDLDYPQERLRYILHNSGARVVLTVESDRQLFEQAGAACLFYRPDWAQAEARTLTAAHVAYVLYTSGSTGQPKGVRVTHGNVSALLDWAESALSRRERRCVLASTSVCFDLSVFELFVPLCLGTSCHIVNSILDLIERPSVAISLINTVPSAIDALLAAQALPDSVETALVAGEPFRQTLVEQLYEQTRVRRVLDLYGPTEDTVYSTWAERRPREAESIGQPLPGTRAYILDAQQQPVPIGLPGELYLAGNGLSLGYQGRADLTEQVFVLPASLAHLEARTYRTGDIVRFLQDGRIAYLGRRDHQVKIRGYRIELNEVEAALQSYPGVRHAVAHIVYGADAKPALVGYIVWLPDAVDPDGLRRHLELRLPVYMRPAQLMPLDALPRTLNGKVDRKALPAPELAAVHGGALTHDIERALASLWGQILRREPQHRAAHFIDLGGNSLSAVKLRVAIQQRFAVELPLAVLITVPTLGAQADLIRDMCSSPADRDGQEIEEFEL